MLRRRYSFFRQSEVARFPMAARYQEGTHPLAPVVARRQATHFLQSACISLSPITEARRAAVWGERSCCYLAAISLKGLCGYFSPEGRTRVALAASILQHFPTTAAAVAMVRRKRTTRVAREREGDLPGLVVVSRVSHSSAWGAAGPVAGPFLPALVVWGAPSFRSPVFPSLGVLLPPSSSFESEPEVFLLPGAWGWGKDKATFHVPLYTLQNPVSSSDVERPDSPLEYWAQPLSILK